MRACTAREFTPATRTVLLLFVTGSVSSSSQDDSTVSRVLGIEQPQNCNTSPVSCFDNSPAAATDTPRLGRLPCESHPLAVPEERTILIPGPDASKTSGHDGQR